MNSNPVNTLCRAVLALAALALLAACSAPASVTPGVSQALKDSWETAFNRSDAAAVTALYAPDAQLVMSGSKTSKGTAAIRTAVEAMIKTGAKVHVETAQNVGAGDMAYVYGTYTLLDHEGGAVIERGSYLEVWRRLDGAWKLSLDVNAAGPAAATAAPTTPAPPPST